MIRTILFLKLKRPIDYNKRKQDPPLFRSIEDEDGEDGVNVGVQYTLLLLWSNPMNTSWIYYKNILLLIYEYFSYNFQPLINLN
jgi:hypothetical protein